MFRFETMESTAEPTQSNQQETSNDTWHRQPIAVTHQNLCVAITSWQNKNTIQSQNPLPQSPKAMESSPQYQTWIHPCNKEIRLVGTQTEAILYVFFNIPCFFSKVELENFLGVVSPNHNVGGALLKILEAKMIIKTKNRISTEQFYLGHFGMEALQRSTIPDIGNRPNNFLESITLRIENGHQLINERAERLKATKKRDLPAKTSTKITPQQK
jgi:hypothetical protein